MLLIASMAPSVFAADNKASSQITDYEKAMALEKEAEALLDKGDVIGADMMIKKSIETHPTLEVFDYATKLGQLPNILAANIIIDLLVMRIKNFKTKTIGFRSLRPYYSNGKLITLDIDTITTDQALYNIYNENIDMNFKFGEKKWIIKSCQMLIEKLVPFNPAEPNNREFRRQYLVNIYVKATMGEYDQAELLIKNTPSPIENNIDLRNHYRKILYIEQEEYDKAIEVMLADPNERNDHLFLFSIYSAKGDYEKAIAEYPKIVLGNFLEENSEKIAFSAGTFANAKKDYKNALVSFSKVLAMRLDKTKIVTTLTWWLYKYIGDAYVGLKDYNKAKDNYKISLLYYPDFKPSKRALELLDTDQSKSILNDKQGPQIQIIEPLKQRGVKVTVARNTVLIRGTALDPSGIKEITINGKEVYHQESGDFWGEVAITKGNNQISITATDLAGNKTQDTLLVIGNPTADVVEEKTGKNYCLLIASQNYLDPTITSLNHPIADAIKLKLILKNQYGFEENNIIKRFDPDNDMIKRELLELSTRIKPEDNLIIFYAGHGVWSEEDKKGYWLMNDAKKDDRSTWMPNSTILDLIAKLPTKHTLLIADACFSGSVFKSRAIDIKTPIIVDEFRKKITRVAITSGNDTAVPDKSVFMKFLIQALNDNKDKFLTTQKMFYNQIMESVINETKIEPRYGTLELAGHIGGDFIFIKNK